MRRKALVGMFGVVKSKIISLLLILVLILGTVPVATIAQPTPPNSFEGKI